MSDIKKQLHELITSNFPAIQASAMQEYIEQAEKDKDRLARSHKAVELLTKDEASLREDVKRLELRVRDLVPYKTRAEEVEEQARNLRVQMAELKVEEAEKRADSIKGLVSTVFANNQVKKTVMTSGFNPVVVPGMAGDFNQGVYPTPSTVESHSYSGTVETIDEN